MPTPRIKICGVNSPLALDATIAARADLCGVNFYPPSPRFASLALARDLAARAAGRITLVGVFVDADDAAIAQACDAARLGAIQLHGAEDPERVAQVRARFARPVWKVISVAGPADIDRAASYVDGADLILFDARTPKGTLPGGMGLSFDWSLLSAWKDRAPWGLAGGLTPANVADAMLQSGAPLVDTASGVESAPGVKDPALIAAFCQAVRAP